MVGRIARLAGALALAGCAAFPPAAVPPGGAVPPPITSRFGDSRSAGEASGRRHWGIDILVPTGTPVLAAAPGVVARVGRSRQAGRLVVVRHASDLSTVYYHLSATAVEPGERVRRGAVLGRSGATGNATGPHLHFGVCRLGTGRCGAGLEGAWDDPEDHWVEGNPCFVSGRAYPGGARRLTYPVACAPATA